VGRAKGRGGNGYCESQEAEASADQNSRSPSSRQLFLSLLGGFGATQVMKSLLVGVKLEDPWTFVAMPILFAVICARCRHRARPR